MDRGESSFLAKNLPLKGGGICHEEEVSLRADCGGGLKQTEVGVPVAEPIRVTGQFRRLRGRHEHLPATYLAFIYRACPWITHRTMFMQQLLTAAGAAIN